MIFKLFAVPGVQSGLGAPELQEAAPGEQVCVLRREGWNGTRPLMPAGSQEDGLPRHTQCLLKRVWGGP